MFLMQKLPILSAKEVINVLKKFGFKVYRQTGSYIHLWDEGKRILVTVPNHKGLAKGTLMAIIKQAGIERGDFISKLK